MPVALVSMFPVPAEGRFDDEGDPPLLATSSAHEFAFVELHVYVALSPCIAFLGIENETSGCLTSKLWDALPWQLKSPKAFISANMVPVLPKILAH